MPERDQAIDQRAKELMRATYRFVQTASRRAAREDEEVKMVAKLLTQAITDLAIKCHAVGMSEESFMELSNLVLEF